MTEFPPPIRVFGEPPLPDEPYGTGTPPVEGRRFGAKAVAAELAARIAALRAGPGRFAGDGEPLLSPPFSLGRDHVEGPVSAPRTLLVFGAFATPASRKLADLIDDVRDRHPGDVRVGWRHYPDPDAHPSAVLLALAAEAGAARGHFWVLTHELLRLRHFDPRDVHDAIVRADLDPDRVYSTMRVRTGADRIEADVASAQASGVMFSPRLFIDGERYDGELDAALLDDALAHTRDAPHSRS